MVQIEKIKHTGDGRVESFNLDGGDDPIKQIVDKINEIIDELNAK